MKHSFMTRLTLSALLLGCTAMAQAQWMWVNDKGVKQLSDQPPPVGTPANRILKAPPGQMPDLRKELNAAAAAPEDKDKAAEAAASKAPARQTVAERNADYNKRQKEAAEKAQQSAQDAQQASAKADNCANARKNLKVLESGQRISDVDANGEKTFMSDEQRAKRMKEDRAAVDQNCK
jgi:uncharacterized protein (DUF3084 family)